MRAQLLADSSSTRTARKALLKQIAPDRYDPIDYAAANPLVSVIILNHNGAAVLERCLICIQQQTHQNIEIILVDNNSNDGSQSMATALEINLPLQVLQLHENQGVAGGRNAGAAIARGDYLAFIDNDGFAEPDWLENSLAVLLSDDTIGAVSAAVFFSWDTQRVNGFGGGMDRQGYACDFSYNQLLPEAYCPEEVLYPMGCGMVLPRNHYTTIGNLDDALPKWFDDTEVGIRLWNRGLKVVVAYNAIVDHQAHHGDVQRTAQAWKRSLLFEKARIRMVLKYFPLLYLPVWFTRETLHIVTKVLPGRPAHLAVWGMAFLWNLAHLTSALHYREGGIRRPKPFWYLLQKHSLRSEK